MLLRSNGADLALMFGGYPRVGRCALTGACPESRGFVAATLLAVPQRLGQLCDRSSTWGQLNDHFSMITSEPTPLAGGTTTGSDEPIPDPSPDLPLTRLRGAGVDVDPRRAARLVIAVCLVALVVIAAVLVVAGAQKNAQASNLRHHGVPVAVTVTGCTGLLGGSGSNPAGYACKGTYAFEGRRYEQDIPGNTSLRSGAVIRGVIVPGDPYLLSTPAMVASEQASWHVFIAPIILLAAVVLAVTTLLLVRRRKLRGSPVP
jgi:hypothetical protein